MSERARKVWKSQHPPAPLPPPVRPRPRLRRPGQPQMFHPQEVSAAIANLRRAIVAEEHRHPGIVQPIAHRMRELDAVIAAEVDSMVLEGIA